MVDLYTALIIKGRKTIDSVPEKMKAAVLANLEVLGVDGQGNPMESL